MVLATGFVTTFMVSLSLADPINIPKMFVLTLFSAWILGLVSVAMFYDRAKKFSLGQWSVIAFVIAMLLAAILTDVRYTAFFGASHRNDGALSYVALATLAMAAMMSFRSANVGQLRLALLVVGGLLSVYGLLQTTGHDPLRWALIYGPVIGTLGNPDFMSAGIGVSAIATLWWILGTEVIWSRVGGTVLLVLELFIVKRTGSVQGILAFAFGFVVVAIAKLWQINKRVGLVTSIVAGVAAVPVVLGMSNVGPLASHLYRSSFQSRLDYWHAAFSMFKAHPFFGVGIERFGENYGSFAPQKQFAIAQSTDNAHNVFLHLLATGGLLVILPYVFLLGVIFYTAVRAIRISTGPSRFDLLALFAFWFALLLISAISIDNLGIAVWFWISGGVLYATSQEHLTVQNNEPRGRKKNARVAKKQISENATYIAPIASLLLTVLILILMVPMWKTSSALMELQSNRNHLTQAQFVEKIGQVADIQPKNVQTLIFLTDMSLRISDPNLALKFAKSVLEKDPKSLDGHYLSAAAYEMSKQYQLAIPYRVKLLEMDPWKTKNMLELVKDYLQVKDLVNARAIAVKIAKLEPHGDNAVVAAQLVKG